MARGGTRAGSGGPLVETTSLQLGALDALGPPTAMVSSLEGPHQAHVAVRSRPDSTLAEHGLHPSNRQVSSNIVRATLIVTSLMILTPATSRPQDPAAERLYREAQRLAASSSYEAALEEYRLLVQQFPDDTLASKALLRSAELLLGSGDRAAAQRTVDRLLESYARTPEAASGFLIRGEIETEEARTALAVEDARATFRRIALLYGPERYPRLEARVRGLLRSARLSVLLGELGAAERDYLTVIEDEPPNPWSGEAYLGLATIWLQQGEWLSAAELLQSLIDSGASAPAGGEAIETADAPRQRDREQAQRLLDAIYRRLLRPQAGGGHWQRSGRVSIPGLDLREPTGVAAAPDHQLVIVDDKVPATVLLDAGQQILARRPLDDASRPGWTADLVPFVTTPSGVWQAFSGQKIDFKDPKKDGPLKGVEAVARGALGDWYVIAKGWKSLLRYESPRRGWTNLMSEDRPELVDLALDPLGRLLVLDRRTNQVVRIGIDNQPQGTVVRGGWKKPEALAVDQLGFIYVLDRGERRVELFDPNGKAVATLGPLLGDGIELRDPQDLSVDGSGRLWIVDRKLPFLMRAE